MCSLEQLDKRGLCGPSHTPISIFKTVDNVRDKGSKGDVLLRTDLRLVSISRTKEKTTRTLTSHSMPPSLVFGCRLVKA